MKHLFDLDADPYRVYDVECALEEELQERTGFSLSPYHPYIGGSYEDSEGRRGDGRRDADSGRGGFGSFELELMVERQAPHGLGRVSPAVVKLVDGGSA